MKIVERCALWLPEKCPLAFESFPSWVFHLSGKEITVAQGKSGQGGTKRGRRLKRAREG